MLIIENCNSLSELRQKLIDGEEVRTVRQEPCEMTAEEYRQRMIQAFHNADTDELIAVCVLPTEKEFEHLEYFLKKHYKKASCADAVSRQAVVGYLCTHCPDDAECFEDCDDIKNIKSLPPVNPQPKEMM